MDKPLEQDPEFPLWQNWTGPVLLSNEIKRYCNSTPPLIDPFDPDNLKPARYQLTLGPEAILGGGDIFSVSDNKPLVIPAHQVAIVRTNEILNLPRFLIARWNLTVGMVYNGLLWVGALQVDPGWTSYLPCPLYNLSDRDVTIRFKEKLFTIDFVRTTPFISGESISYKMPFEDHPPLNFYSVGFKSGPYEIIHNIGTVQEDFRRLQARIDTNIGLIIAIITLVVAAVAVLLAVALERSTDFDLTNISTSGVAVVLATVALLISSAHFLTRVIDLFRFRRR